MLLASRCFLSCAVEVMRYLNVRPFARGAVTVVAYRAMLWLGRLPGEDRVLQ